MTVRTNARWPNRSAEAPGWRYRGIAMPVDPLRADLFPPCGRCAIQDHWSWVDQETLDSEVPHETVCDQPTRSSGVPGEFPGRVGLLGPGDARSVHRGDRAGFRGEGTDRDRHPGPCR